MAVKYVWYRLFEDGKKIGNVIKYDINLKSKYLNTDVLIDEMRLKEYRKWSMRIGNSGKKNRICFIRL